MVENWPPGYDDPNASIEGFWDHPTQNKWVLYTFEDPQSGDEYYFELHENNNQHREIESEEKFHAQVNLLEQNHQAYDSVTGFGDPGLF